MLDFLSPIDAISSITLLVLAIFGAVELVIIFHHRNYFKKNHLVIFKVDPKISDGKIGDFIKSIKPPFTFEIAIHHLGKEVHYYVALPKNRAKILAGFEEVKEVEDYHLFNHGGEHVGAYFKEGGDWSDIDLAKVDFSKVNEVGEGVAIQMVFGRRRRKGTAVNLRILASAPSSYQAKEILASIKPAFSSFGLIESRGEDFLNEVNFREFNKKELMYWGLKATPSKS
ncbi:hypothetical protein KKH05_02365 [Patescibacteria group bacterium]|nr:hypothetical protein [Patescibacteria group bacterium]